MKPYVLYALVAFSFLPAISQDLQLVVPLGHSRRVTMLEVSHDQAFLASIDGSSQIKLWDYASGKEMYQLSKHTAAIQSIDFHPSENLLLSTSNDGKLQLWDPKGRLKTTIESGKSDLIVAFFTSTGDSIISIGSAAETKIWKTSSGSFLNSIHTKTTNVSTAALWGKLLVTGNNNGELAFNDLTQKKPTKNLKISDSRIGHIHFSQDHRLYVSTDAGELITVFLPTYEVNRTTAFNIRSHQVVAYDRVVFACGRDTDENLKQFNPDDLSLLSTGISFAVNKSSEAFRFGLRAMCKASDTTLLIADYRQTIREWNLKRQAWESRTFSGKAAPIHDLALNQNHTQLAIASGHKDIQILDLTGASFNTLLEGSTEGTRALDFHPVNPVLAAYGMNEEIVVTNLLSATKIFNLKAKGEYNTTPVTFDPTGKYILRKSSEKDFDFYDFKSKAPKKLKVKNGTDYEFSADGRRLIFEIQDGLVVYDPITLKEIASVKIPGIQDFSIARSGEIAVLLSNDQTIKVYSEDLVEINEFQLPPKASSDRIFWSPAQNMLLGIRNTQKKGESHADFSIKLINAKDGSLIGYLPGHSGFVTSHEFIRDQYLVTTSVDGLIKLWNLSDSQKPYLGAIIPLQEGEYVITSPKGHFDATARAMKELHYVKNGEIIALNQLKSEYYEPNLLSKLLGYNAEPVKSVAELSEIQLYPELTIEHPLKNDGKLGINLSNNGGGIGRIIILINGKEVSNDVRHADYQSEQTTMEINYDITDHPFLYNDRVNKITVKAYNQEGTVSSDEKSIYVFGEEKSSEKPALFAVIAGISDYHGESLDLKYAAKDASDFARALELSASQYIGAENTHITLLSTEMDSTFWPTKDHIRQAFEKYSKEAKAKDLLVVYLSGHGVNHSGEDGDFYYLTCDANHGDMNNTVARKNTAISSLEFTEYIKSVPALKQIMIIDACHSGRMATSLAASRSAMSATQIRSLERMKDRTGLFVLAGSAADAVSYETTLFGQGLLTYSLLFGMKGAALRDDEFIDVIQLFQFAANKVPELAEEIGGIQKPEVRLPEEGKSFDIGRLTKEDREKIAIKAPKPVYVHSRFQDETAIFDRLKVSELLDRKLLEASREKDPKIVFVDDKSFSGASTIHGRYIGDGGLLKAKITIVNQDEIKNDFEVEAVNAKILVDQIMVKILEQTDVEKIKLTN